jgi:hypothetical protein
METKFYVRCPYGLHTYHTFVRLRLKCDGTRAETRFRLSTKRTSPFKTAGGVSSVDSGQPSCAHQPAGFVLIVQGLCSAVTWRLLVPPSILWVPPHFPTRASPCAITFQKQFYFDNTTGMTHLKSLTVFTLNGVWRHHHHLILILVPLLHVCEHNSGIMGQIFLDPMQKESAPPPPSTHSQTDTLRRTMEQLT